jgi:predicted nucleotidyltransferase
MLTKKQLEIFEAFLKNPYKELTFKDIKGKHKSNANVQSAIATFLKEKLIKKRKIANLNLYTANTKNPKTAHYFSLISLETLPQKAKVSIDIIIKELQDIPFLTLIIFGSYAKNTYNKNSDLDIAIFVKDPADKRLAELSTNEAQIKSILELDAHVFTADEMSEMLVDKKQNLGKQIVYEHLPILGAQAFYAIINKNLDDGFTIISYQKHKQDPQ